MVDPNILPVTPEAPQPAAPVEFAPPVEPAAPNASLPPSPAEAPTGPAVAGQPVPPPPAAVPPTVSAPPAVDPQLDEYVARLEEQNARTQSHEDQRVLQDFVGARAAQLENEQGFTAEQARAVAEREGQAAFRSFHAELFREGQINAAFEIGQHFGVDPRRLMGLPTPEAMGQAAIAMTGQSRIYGRFRALEAENAALKKRLAPPQRFATGAAPVQPSGSYIESLKSGGPLPPAAEIDAYTRRYLTGSA